MEATCSSEMAVDFHQTTLRYIPEHRNLLVLSDSDWISPALESLYRKFEGLLRLFILSRCRPETQVGVWDRESMRSRLSVTDLILSALLVYAGTERDREKEKSWKFVLDVFLSLFSAMVVAVVASAAAAAAATKPVSEVQQLAACQSEAQKPCYRPSPCNQTWNTLQMYPATYCFRDVVSDVSKHFKLRNLRESPSHGD
jgi:hypothetical protein